MMIKIKRIYQSAEPTDGHRVLVDRLWPRGITRERAKVDEWLKEIAPSHELRKWFHKQPEQWNEFERRYVKELRSPLKKELIEQLRDRAVDGTITLLFSVRDEIHNHASVLRNMLLGQPDENRFKEN